MIVFMLMYFIVYRQYIFIITILSYDCNYKYIKTIIFSFIILICIVLFIFTYLYLRVF